MGGKIIIAQSSSQERTMIVDFLRKAGHQVVAETSDLGHTLRRARSLYCDLVIVDQNLEGGKGLRAAAILEEDQLAAVLLLVDSDVFPQARNFHYLVKPIYYYTIIPAVEAALMYQKRQLELREKIKVLEKKLKTQKLLDRAKGLLMDKLKISENEAHRFIQKNAMDMGLNLDQVALEILSREKSGRD